jgi:hypothetical protein
MPGVTFEEVWTALTDGYNKRELGQMLRTRLDIVLEDIVADGPMRNMASDLLGYAERRGLVVDLIREAYRFNPRNSKLQAVYQKYGLATDVSLQRVGVPLLAGPRPATDGGFEAKVKEHLGFLEVVQWREQLVKLEGRVCRVELNDGSGGMGTGFLVGPDALLTNYHVLEAVIRDPSRAGGVRFRFDYKRLADGSTTDGVLAALRPGGKDDWLLDHGPYTPAEAKGEPDAALPTVEELDFALVRLSEPVGQRPLTPKGVGGPSRGWVRVPESAPAVSPKMPIFILQHPQKGPLKLALDTEGVLGVNANGTRVRYATTTEGGSSGSPCFDMNWTLIALHHYGDPAVQHAPEYNQGIPIGAIRDRLRANGKDSALGGDVHGSPAAAEVATGTPIGDAVGAAEQAKPDPRDNWIRENVHPFLEECREADGRLGRLRMYKALHNCLQIIHLQYPEIARATRTLGDDEGMTTDLESYADTLEAAAAKAEGIFGLDDLAPERAWVEKLKCSATELRKAADPTRPDPVCAERARLVLDRVLAWEPARINGILLRTIRDLRLQDLISSCKQVIERFPADGTAPVGGPISTGENPAARRQKLERWLAEIEPFPARLDQLVADHSAWQNLDTAVRLAQKSRQRYLIREQQQASSPGSAGQLRAPGNDQEEQLDRLLEDCQDVLDKLATVQPTTGPHDRARFMEQYAHELTAAVKDRILDRVVELFRPFCHLAALRFAEIDQELLALIDRLPRLGLASTVTPGESGQ